MPASFEMLTEAGANRRGACRFGAYIQPNLEPWRFQTWATNRWDPASSLLPLKLCGPPQEPVPQGMKQQQPAANDQQVRLRQCRPGRCHDAVTSRLCAQEPTAQAGQDKKYQRRPLSTGEKEVVCAMLAITKVSVLQSRGVQGLDKCPSDVQHVKLVLVRAAKWLPGS